MTWQGRFAVVAVFVAAELAASELIPPSIGLPIIGLAVVAAWRGVPGFWRMMVGGLVGGVLAGALVLGPGFRVAMRVVAVMDPVHPQEFTIGGTIFVIVGIGAIMGGVTAMTAHLLRRVLHVRSAIVSGTVLGVYTIGSLLFFSDDIRQEFFDLGGGAWVNVPLFGVFAVAYGIAGMALADRFEKFTFGRKGAEREKVAA